MSAGGCVFHDKSEVAGQLVGGAESLEDNVVFQAALAGKQRRLAKVASSDRLKKNRF
jgi:hypothetical protein